MKHYGDITELSGAELPVVDVIVGGSPCQDLSIAGSRAGLDGDRSNLFFEQIRIVKEMRERDRREGRAVKFIRPRYMVWENVSPFHSNKGKDFQTVLTEIVRIVRKDSPDVPLPNRGGVEPIRMSYGIRRRRMPVFHRLESTRCTVLGCPPEKKTYRTCR